MVVISLFDGMCAGLLALKKASIEVSAYFASEIDKYAMQIAKNNNPEIIHIGDVTKVRYKKGVLYTEHGQHNVPRVDMVIGGSPCQGFSIAGKQLNFDDPRSKLFFEYHRIVQECKADNPDLLFMLENVRMKAEHETVITQYMGVNPVLINSALLSAQNRERLYWTNINQKPKGLFGDLYTDIPQPADKGILLKHVLQSETEIEDKYYLSAKALARIERKLYSDPRFFDADNPDKTGTINTKNNGGQLSIDSGTTLVQKGVVNYYGELKDSNHKALCIDANYAKGMDNHGQRTMIVHALLSNSEENFVKVDIEITKKLNQDKAACLTVAGHSGGHHSDMDLLVIGDTGYQNQNQNKDKILDNEKSPPLRSRIGAAHDTKVSNSSYLRIRRLTEIECERLQTVPDNYTFGVSSTQRYKMLGNGWTADVVAYIFSFLPDKFKIQTT